MKVSVLVASFQGRGLLPACLDALAAQTFRDFEAIVVDNGSDDGSREYLAAWRGPLALKTVLLPMNTGFTGANHAAFALATGEIVALLNNDAQPEPQWLQRAVEALEARPEAGMLASCLLRQGEPALIDSAGDQLSSAGRGLKRGSGEPAVGYAEGAWVFSPCGAAALYRRSMIEDIGFLDDAFFFNYEDMDLAFRAQLRGWRCWYEPAARVRHAVGASHALLGADTYFYWSRNAEWLWMKNAPPGLWWATLPSRTLQEALTFVRHLGAPRRALAFGLGKLAAWTSLLPLLRRRAGVQALRRLDDGQVRALLVPGLSRAEWGRKWSRLWQGA